MNFSRYEARKAVEAMKNELDAIQKTLPYMAIGLIQMQGVCELLIHLDESVKILETWTSQFQERK